MKVAVASAHQLTVVGQLGLFSQQMLQLQILLYLPCGCLLVRLCEVSDYIAAADSKLASPSSINLPIKNLQPVCSQLQQCTFSLTFYFQATLIITSHSELSCRACSSGSSLMRPKITPSSPNTSNHNGGTHGDNISATICQKKSL